MVLEDESIQREISRKLADYLTEVALEKREVRQRAAQAESARREASRWSRFWTWVTANTVSLSAMVTVVSVIIGASWTLKQYFDQERERVEQRARESELERRKTIANFAGDLSDPTKRNGAAYALAVLGGEGAIPLLAQHLRESAASEKEASFREALAQALIVIGPASLEAVVRLQRESVAGYNEGSVYPEMFQRATQPVIVHFLRQRVPSLVEHGPTLAGIVLRSADLRYANLDQLNLSGMTFMSVTFCGTSLRKAVLHQASFRDPVHLGNANLQSAVLTESRLVDADLNGANLQEANLTRSDLSRADLDYGKLTRAILVDVDFKEARLAAADLSGADLAGAKFSWSADDVPSAMFDRGSGAHVLRANFQGARNIDADARRYLCRAGASNVPGGCEGIEVLELSGPKSEPGYGFGPSSCW